MEVKLGPHPISCDHRFLSLEFDRCEECGDWLVEMWEYEYVKRAVFYLETGQRVAKAFMRINHGVSVVWSHSMVDGAVWK